VFCAQVEVSDELELAPVFAMALSGCNLRCDFCITRAESWDAAQGVEAHPRQWAARAEQALSQGARTIMLLGGEPTIHLPTALEIVAALPDHARLAWKTNAYGSAQARALLEGLFEVWVADFKFGNDPCAARLAGGTFQSHELAVRSAGFHTGFADGRTSKAGLEAGAPAHGPSGYSSGLPPGVSYVRIVRENLLWASAHAELIVRHLLMPGHIDCCWRPVAAWLAAELPGVKVNLRSGFWPSGQTARHPELRRTVSPAETELAHAIAREHRLHLIT
jgi:putative pyruvate formate lyase activating enzyme